MDAAILLVDDNPEVALAIELAFDCAGYRVDTAAEPETALSMLARRRYDSILLDLNFRPGRTDGAEGIAFLDRIFADDPAAVVVVITAHSGVRVAVAAMQKGALDFVMKPWRNADLVARVEAAIDKRSRSAARRIQPLTASQTPHGLLGDSRAAVDARAIIRKVAPTRAGVLISGAPGTGRTLAATLLHEGSTKAGGQPTIVDARDAGSWSQADGAAGTLILRHPDELDAVLQEQLLDRLSPLLRTITIVDAPDRLAPRLRHTLGTIEIRLPPLKERGEDALLLARHFAAIAADRHGRRVPIFTASAEAAILAASWPDEIGGLERAIERAILLDEDGIIDGATLAEWTLPTLADHRRREATAPLDINLRDSERLIIEAALRQHKHNVSHTAEALGLSRQALYRRMTRYGL